MLVSPNFRRRGVGLFLFFGIVVSTGAAPVAAPQSPTPSAPASETPAQPSQPAGTPSKAVEISVVKIFSTARYPDVYKPWLRQAPSESSGSGVVIEGKRILTNAHVIRYAGQIQVQASQSGDRFSATVEAVAPGIDLAVLKLDDPKFFASHPPLPRARDLPDIKDAVTVYGYPEGGTSLAITRGIVSRIEFGGYNYPVVGLRIQIDAAVNAGNSGGPAVVDNKLVGIIFSRLNTAENIGYIIPSEEIELFLQDIADGHYDGKPALFDELQTLDNLALRPYLKLPESVQGTLVHRPASNAADYPLKEWDLITRIGDAPVDNQGMIKLGENLLVRFSYLVQKIARQGKVPLTILRAGKEMQVEVPVSSSFPQLNPSLRGTLPSYFVYGPIAFSESNGSLLADFTEGKNAADWILDRCYDGNPMLTRAGERPSFPEERLVFVSSPFFPHKLAHGYSNPAISVVKTVNGIAIKNLAHLVQVLRDLKDEFVVFAFDRKSGGETMVFPRAEMMAATEEILTDNGVRSQGSPNLISIWNAKTPEPGK
jgi:S1-C subfamily serine protease